MFEGSEAKEVGRTVMILTVPAAVALAAAALFGWLGWFAALLCLVLAVGIAWPVARRHVADLDRLRSLAAGIADGKTAVPMHFDGSLGTEEIGAALARGAARLQGKIADLEQKLRLAEDLAQALPDPMLLIAQDRRVLRSNQAAESLFGPGLVGRTLAEAARDPSVLSAAQGALDEGRVSSGAFTIAGPVPRNMICRAIPLGDARPGGAAAILLMEDITEVKRSEQMRADFVANASHEIRTPLASVAGFLETLTGPAKDDPAAREKFLAAMGEQVARIRRLVDDLLSLSRIEVREHMAPTEPIDIERVLSSAVDALAYQAKTKAVALDLQVAPDLARIAGDAAELEQVFNNLIDNAIAYGAGKPVSIRARIAAPDEAIGGKPSIIVTIADQGPGIAREHLPRLTERFYRIDAARSRQMGGTGLGLAIVKHIVNRHRAQLTIKSTLGKGSEFSVIFQSII